MRCEVAAFYYYCAQNLPCCMLCTSLNRPCMTSCQSPEGPIVARGSCNTIGAMDELKPCLLDLPMPLLSHIMTFLASEPPNHLPNALLVCHGFRAAAEPVLAPWLAQVALAITTAKLKKAREAGLEEQLLAFLGRQALMRSCAVLEVEDERSLRRVLDSLSPGSCGRGLRQLQLQSRRVLVESRWCSFGLAAVPEVGPCCVYVRSMLLGVRG